MRAHLILMDKGKLAAHDGMPSWFRIVRRADASLHTAEFVGDADLARRDPLTIGINVTAEVRDLETAVRETTGVLLASLEPELKRLPNPIGGHCKGCEFRVSADEPRNGFLECWGVRGRAEPHVLDLHRGGDLRDRLLATGVDRVQDITDAHFAGRSGVTMVRQQRHVRQTRLDEEWIDPRLGDAIRAVQWPMHFADFEAARIAVPHHKGMRPYGQIAFQWSCHTRDAPDAPLRHREFLNADATWPNEHFGRTLRETIGDEGSVLVWSPFESAVLRSVADDLTRLGTGDKDLAGWLRTTAIPTGIANSRQVDMLKLCREHYYHPKMGGSYSIKRVLDAIWRSAPAVRDRFAEIEGRAGDPERGPYASLPPALIADAEESVAEGTGAIRAYFRMAYGVEKDDPSAVAQWSQLLRAYCKLDTLAMVLIWEHWGRIVR